MKVITVRQPWAWLIVSGHKDIENRTWQTRYRGPVAIHASKAVPYQEDCDAIAEKFGIVLPDDFDVGGIIGTVEIVDCVTSHPSRWFGGPHGFVLGNPKPCKLIPCPGKLGLWDCQNVPRGKVAI